MARAVRGPDSLPADAPDVRGVSADDPEPSRIVNDAMQRAATLDSEDHEFNVVPRGERLSEPFEVADGVTIPTGPYHFPRFRLEGRRRRSSSWFPHRMSDDARWAAVAQALGPEG